MNGDRAGLHFESHYAGDRAKRERVHDIIERTFGLDLGPLTEFDFHDPSFTPFSYFDAGGVCVANVAVYRMPMMLGGERVEALAMQSVCTGPAWRMKGLFRDLVNRALEWCDTQVSHIILKTDTPSLYYRFGFEKRDRTRFLVATAGIVPEIEVDVRALDIRADVALVKHLFRVRTPVSNLVGPLDHGTIFFLETASVEGYQLRYLPAYETMMVTRESADGTLQIVNLIGTAIPPFSVLLGALDRVPDIVEFGFPPDRLGVNVTLALLVDTATIMTRGPFLSGNQPFRLPLGGI